MSGSAQRGAERKILEISEKRRENRGEKVFLLLGCLGFRFRVGAGGPPPVLRFFCGDSGHANRFGFPANGTAYPR